MTIDRRASTYLAIATSFLIAGIVAAEPASSALGAAFLVPLLTGLASRTRRAPTLDVSLDRDRLLESGSVRVSALVASAHAHSWLELVVAPPDGSSDTGTHGRRVFALDAMEQRTIEFDLTFDRWGVYRLAPPTICSADWRLTHTVASSGPLVVRVYPRLHTLRSLVDPETTRLAAGNRRARTTGSGVEFAEIREFRPGDRLRRINWRATLRSDRLLVADRHPEQSSDVVIILDALAPRGDHGSRTLDDSVRATATLAAAHLARRDRVGLLTFASAIEWVRPSDSHQQLYQIVDAAMSAETTRFHRAQDLRLIPRRVLPPGAEVVALTPLLDYRVVHALLNLRARGWDVSVIEVDSARGEPERESASPEAWRIWQLERRLTRRQLRGAGCTTAHWDGDRPLADVVSELGRQR